jgi:RNA polymerase sigma-70 factor (ECF subfamily)
MNQREAAGGPDSLGPPSEQDRRGRKWFEQLFRDHHVQVRAYARRRVGADADDIVAEVFTTAWQRRQVVPEEALPWLYRTAAHHVLHARRSWAGQARTSQAVADESQSWARTSMEDDFATATAEADLLERGLRELPEDDQEVLRLWAWEQLGAAQIAEVLGCRPSTARVRLHRARRRLRTQLNGTGDETPSRSEPGRSASPLNPRPMIRENS